MLWSVLQTLVQWVLAILADRPFPLGELVRIAWRPVGQFWFLYALCVCHLLALVAIRPDSGVADNRGRLAADALPGALAVPCAALAMMTLWGVATMTFLGIAFSMMGAVMARGAARGIGARARVSVILALAVVFLGAIGIGRRFGGYQNVYAWPANVAGAALVVAAAQWLGPKHFAHGVAWLGRGWKPVFVLYVMAASLVWTAPLSAGITLDIVHVIFGALAGIGLPLLLYFIAQRFRLARFAGFCEDPAHGSREGAHGGACVLGLHLKSLLPDLSLGTLAAKVIADYIVGVALAWFAHFPNMSAGSRTAGFAGAKHGPWRRVLLLDLGDLCGSRT